MNFEDIVSHLEHVPHMPPDRGKLVYEFIRAKQPRDILEIGFAHGTSTCYMAAALEENGEGHILTLDHVTAKNREPDIQTMMRRTGLERFITPLYAERSYTWELMKLIEANTRAGHTTPQFDFVFIDGGHTWDSDGFSFLLADRLLRPGGYVLFDDVVWIPSECAGEAWVDELPESERNVAHVEKIFNLLVVTDSSYDGFELDGVWAWAHKRNDVDTGVNRENALRDLYSQTSAARRSLLLRRVIKKLFRLG